jgi:hypothetical protein
MNLSELSKKELIAAGWLENKSRDVEPFKNTYKKERYTILPAALRFLEQFGGLEGEHRANHGEKKSRFTFDACQAAEDIPKERVDVYALRFGQALIPVGEIDSGHVTLLISDSGSLLGGFDNYLWLLGNTVEEGLNTIFESRNYNELPG